MRQMYWGSERMGAICEGMRAPGRVGVFGRDGHTFWGHSGQWGVPASFVTPWFCESKSFSLEIFPSFSKIVFICVYTVAWAFLVAQRLKHLPAMWGPGFYPWVRKIPWRRKWQPTPVFLPGESHGRRSLVGSSPWGRKELDTTERLHFHLHSCFSHVWLLAILWTVAHQAPLSMGFFRQEY